MIPTLAVIVFATAADPEWIDLNALEVWKPAPGWKAVGSVALDGKDPKQLAATAGDGILANAPRGRTANLETRQSFADAEFRCEFLIPRGSNAGVKLMGAYEIQILDTHAATTLNGNSCGGIYPRGEDRPRYHTIDNGTPPRINAAKPPGEWQSLEITFRAPRFDAAGLKTSHARFDRVVLNGALIHENAEVRYPTGSAWRVKKEVAAAPLLLQGDHGPVAFRNVRVRPLGETVTTP